MLEQAEVDIDAILFQREQALLDLSGGRKPRVLLEQKPTGYIKRLVVNWNKQRKNHAQILATGRLRNDVIMAEIIQTVRVKAK